MSGASNRQVLGLQDKITYRMLYDDRKGKNDKESGNPECVVLE